MLERLDFFAMRTAAEIADKQCRHTERTQVHLFFVTVVHIRMFSSNEALCVVWYCEKPAVTCNVYPIFAW